MKAHNLLNIVQRQQTLLYDSDEQKQQLLIITPTFARTFQALHLTCLIHTLRNVPFPLTWIVVEADGLSNETADLLAHSQLPFHHLTFSERMPAPFDQRWQLEIRLRIEGLRFIRTNRLDGIVLFVDDSNTYSLDFFKEAQRTKWMGGFSIGLLPDFGGEEGKSSTIMPVLHLQGPVCDASGQISGWYTPFKVRNDLHISDQSALDWAGFSLNAKLLWEGFESPAGFIKWNRLFQEKPNLFVSPLNFVRNYTLVQPLGDCGCSILLWRSRVEARADSKFPSRWEINPGLEIVVPSKRTPWVDHHLQRHRSTRHSDLTDLNQKHRGRVRRKLKVPV
ncbi:hypothetical protein KP509_06G068100 [Ceratopteris richardii]|nr:hypothetical protein KP509_06G068100 [Ceratopteris richardii]